MGKGRRHSAERAQSLVEYALVAPLIFMLVFAMVDLGRLFFTQFALQNALRQAGRFAVTGNHLPDPAHTGQTLSRVTSIIQVAQQAAPGIDVSGIQISSTFGGSAGAGRAGGPGDTITLTLTSQLHLITPMISRFFGPNGVYTFTVSTSFRNEPFAPWQQN